MGRIQHERDAFVYCGKVSSFDSDQFRAVLAHVPTSVVVVTGLDAHSEPHGITIGSFTSVSLDPPLVGFFPGLNSTSWPLIEAGGSFCVNVLSSAQSELCWKFAKEADNRFAGIDWSAAPSGSPILGGCLAWIDCTIHSVTEVGDHYFVVGRVEHLISTDPTADAMVFFGGKVTSVGRSE